jgi:hypothetical protein
LSPGQGSSSARPACRESQKNSHFESRSNFSRVSSI